MTHPIGNSQNFGSLFLAGISSNTRWVSEPLVATVGLQRPLSPSPSSVRACESVPSVTSCISRPCLALFTASRRGEDGGSLRQSPHVATAPSSSRHHPAMPARHQRHPTTCSASPCRKSHPWHWRSTETASRPCRGQDMDTTAPGLLAYLNPPRACHKPHTTPLPLLDISPSSPSSRFALELDAGELWTRSRPAALDHLRPPLPD
jgi:hypothetical protein